MLNICYFCVCRFLDLFLLYLWAPLSLLRFEHLIFLFLLLVDLLFSLDLLLSLYLWGLFPLSVLNICYFCLLLPWFVIFVRFAIFVIFVIFVGPPSLLFSTFVIFVSLACWFVISPIYISYFRCFCDTPSLLCLKHLLLLFLLLADLLFSG